MADSNSQQVADPRQVVFIDSNVPDIQDLLNGLQPGAIAFVLDPSSDGLTQIADILSANDLSGLASISIIGHGAPGAIDLGSSVLDDADLEDEAASLADIGASLTPGGDLQLYACDVASGAGGRQFIADLSSFAGGATVAASTSIIGQTPAGENWTLDAAANANGAAALPGNAPTPFTAAAQADFSGTLSAPTTEMWVVATAGGNQNLILHADNTGTNSASNVGTLFTPVSSNNPSAADDLEGIDLFQFDTQNDEYFIVPQDSSGSNGKTDEVLEGSLTSALTDPTGTPTYTTLYSNPNAATEGIEILGLADDPTSKQVFFIEGNDFDKVSYAGGAVTTVGTTGSGGPFLNGLALDLPAHVAYFINSSQVNSTTTTKHGVVLTSAPSPITSQEHVHHIVTSQGSIYETSSLTASSGSDSVSISKLMSIPASLGQIGGGIGVPGFTVDTKTGLIYFTTQTIAGTTPAEGGIFVLNPSTQAITTLFRQAAGQSDMLDAGVFTAIQVDDATGLYYVSLVGAGGEGGAIYVGSLATPGTPTLFETIPTYSSNTIKPGAEGLALDNAPTLAITATNPTFTESALNPASAHNTPVALLTSASVGDSDNTSLASATVSIGSFFAGDVLSFSNNNNITGSYNSSTGVLTFSGVDSFTDYDTALQSVDFTSTSDNPTDYGSDTSRTLSWVVNDGLLASAAQTEAVTVVGVNDPPTLSGIATSAHFTEAAGAVTLSNGVSVIDVDDLDLSSATVSITGGTFAGDGDVLAATTTSTSITASYNSTTETLTLSGTDTLAHYQQVLDSVTFNSTSQNPTDYGSNQIRTLTWRVQDPSGTANGGQDTSTLSTTTASITAVNNPPTVSSVATSVSFTEQGAAVTLSNAVSASDPDNLDLASATVKVAGGTFSNDGDVLSATGTASIAVSYNSSTETLTLTGGDTLADYAAVLDTVTFGDPASLNPTDFGSHATRSVTWVLNDGSGSNNLSTAATTTVSITAVNNPPTLSGVATGATFVQSEAAVTLSSAVSVTDPDNLDLAAATVVVTTGTFAGDGDVLAATTTGTSITASYNSSAETLVLSGSDTLAHYQQVLDSVTFNSTAADPTDGGADKSRQVTWVLNDGGTSNNLSTTATTTIAIIGAPSSATSTISASPTTVTANGTSFTSVTVTVEDAFGDLVPGASVVLSSTGTGDNFTPASGTTNQNGVFTATLTSTTAEPDTITATEGAAQESTQVTFVAGPPSGSTSTVTATPSTVTANGSALTTLTVTVKDANGNLVSGASVTLSGNGSGNTFGPASGTTNQNGVFITTLASSVVQTETITATEGGVHETTTVTFVPAPPTLSNVLSGVDFVAQQTTGVTLSSSVSITDVGAADLASATVSITGGTFANDHDVLAATTTGTAITASYNSSTETLTLSGSDTLGHYQQVLDSVTFDSTAADPSNGGADPTRTLHWELNNGDASSNLSAVVTSTVSIAALDATQTTSLTTDADHDGGTSPGDTVTTSVVIDNASPTNTLNGVSFSETPSGLTFVGGSLKVTPIAVSDTYSATGNTPLTVTAGNGVLANDVSPDGSALTAINATSAVGGAVTLNSNGSFTFTPTTGFSGTASFQYTAESANGLASDQTGKVTINVGAPTWYVSTTGSDTTGTGTAANPFATIEKAVTTAGANSTIMVAAGSYSGAGITLASGEQLVGAGGVTFSVSSGNAVTLNSGNTISGITIDDTGSGAGITDDGGSVGTLDLSNIAVSTGSGTGISLKHGGTVTATGTNTLSASTGTALDVENTTIGSGGLTFKSISDTGSSNNAGIILINTGSSGGLTVTGDGTSTAGGNSSGGTIANKTGSLDLSGTDGVTETLSSTNGVGIVLENTLDPSFNNLTLQSFSNFAIYGSSVTGFNLSNSTVDTTSGFNGQSDAGGSEEGDIRFDNLSGNAAITGSTISDGYDDGINIQDGENSVTTGTLNLTTSGDQLGFVGHNTNILLTAWQNTTFNATATNNTFLGTAADFFSFVGQGASTTNAIVSGNTFEFGETPISGGSDPISISGDQGTWDVINNNIDSSATDSTTGTGTANGYQEQAIFIDATDGSGTVKSTVEGNNIGPASTTSNNADGIAVQTVFSETLDSLIENNTLTGYGGEGGISLLATQGTNTLNASVYGNTESNPDNSNSFGLAVTGAGTGGQVSTINLVVGSATVSSDKNTFAGFELPVAFSNLSSSDSINLSEDGGGSSSIQSVLDNDNNGTPTWTSGGLKNPVLVTSLPTTPPAVPALLTSGFSISGTAEEGQSLTASQTASEYQWQEAFSGSGYVNIVGAAAQSFTPTEAQVGATLRVVELELNSDGTQDTATSAATSAVADDLTLTTPSITGTAQVGQVLTASTPTSDNADATITYQWQDNGSNISGATGQTYAVVAADQGHTIRVVATATDPHGGDISETSGATASVTAASNSPSSVDIGTLAAGNSTTISFEETVNAQSDQLIVNPVNSGTVSGGNFSSVTTNTDTTTLDTLTLGGVIFADANNNGTFDAGESGLNGVAMSVFVQGSNTALESTTTTTIGGQAGSYQFVGLAAGNYYVQIAASNFGNGQALAAFNNSSNTRDTTPNDYQGGRNYGLAISAGVIDTNPITIAYDAPEPTNGPVDTTDTLDIGMIEQPPVALSGTTNAAFTENGGSVTLSPSVTVSQRHRGAERRHVRQRRRCAQRNRHGLNCGELQLLDRDPDADRQRHAGGLCGCAGYGHVQQYQRQPDRLRLGPKPRRGLDAQ